MHACVFLTVCTCVCVCVCAYRSLWVLGQGREMDAPDWGCVSFLSPVRRPAGSWPSEERENRPRWAASTGRAPQRNGSLAFAPTGWYTPPKPAKHNTELYWPDQTHILNPVWNYCKRNDGRMTMSFERERVKKKQTWVMSKGGKKDRKCGYEVKTLTSTIKKWRVKIIQEWKLKSVHTSKYAQVFR